MSSVQEKLLLRVKTANDEVAHLKEFDYGELVSCCLCICDVFAVAICVQCDVDSPLHELTLKQKSIVS